MNKEIQSEAIRTWGRKDEIEKTLAMGMNGMPEINRDERLYYLGELKERIICLLSKKQVTEAAIYPEIIQALKNERADKVIIDGSIPVSFAEKYRILANKKKIHYLVRSDPDFKGTVGLLVISNEAVDIPVITVEERSLRLQRLGMSLALIKSVGKKVCKSCFQKIVEIDPAETVNYKRLAWIDCLVGDECPAHENE